MSDLKTHGGKGSGQRPTNRASYEANYDAIFGKKKAKKECTHECLDCGALLNEEDMYQTTELEAYDIGDTVVHETVVFNHCDKCNSENVEERLGEDDDC